MLKTNSEHMADRQSALLHRSAGKCRKTDHVPGRIDVRYIGLKEFVDFYLATRIDRYAGSFEMKLISIGLAAYSVNERIAIDFFAALQFREYAIVGGVNSNLRHFLPEDETW